MLYQIVSLLLEVAAGLLTGTCLLRLYMQHQRIPMSARAGNPMGPFIFALTDWLVLPLRKVLPAMGRWDTASFVGAFFAQLVKVSLLWIFDDRPGPPVRAVFEVMHAGLLGLSGLVIIYAVLSWVQTSSHLSDLLERLVAPPLAPIRKLLPLVGGVDLSPLALLVLVQVALFVLAKVQEQCLVMWMMLW